MFLSWAFTSAPFASSAFTLSVWPLKHAKCSAVYPVYPVYLHGTNMYTMRRTAQASRRKGALGIVRGVHGRTLRKQRLHALRVAIL
jgi:hypothetical protein